MKKRYDITNLLKGSAVVIIIMVVSYYLIWLSDYTNITANIIIKYLLIIIWIEFILILLVLLCWLIFVGENSIISIVQNEKIKRYCKYLDECEKKGVPTGMSYLRKLAKKYKTPIILKVNSSNKK